jgi:hypothetical protein
MAKSRSLNAPKKGANKKRSTKLPAVKQPKGAPFSEQDPKRRLGNFSGAGEHPRKGGRTSGVVGQTTKRTHTDKHS